MQGACCTYTCSTLPFSLLAAWKTSDGAKVVVCKEKRDIVGNIQSAAFILFLYLFVQSQEF
jgi:hypothetical protein